MKLFKQYRYACNSYVKKYIFRLFLLLLILITTGLKQSYFISNISHITSYNHSNLLPTKKRKKKRYSASAPKKDLASIRKEEFRKLEVRIMEKETKLKSYERIAPDVEFRVQIFASKGRIDPSELKKKFGLNCEIKENFINGWFKYSVGSFIKYWQAREYRKKLISNNFIYDAFVVAYQFEKPVALHTLVSKEEWEAENIKLLTGKLLPVEAGKYSIRFLKIRNIKIPVETISDIYGNEEKIYCQQANGYYHYIKGIYDSYNEAATVRNKLRLEGNEDAIVVGDSLLFQIPEGVDFLSNNGSK